MIRENSLFCRLIRIKCSLKALFDSFMAGFRPELQTCPCCGAKGSCRIHAYYDRSLVDFMGGRSVRHSLCILRLICSCGHTHAILPDFIIPHSGYGLFFLLRVLAEYFLHLSTVEGLCERFSITLSQLRRIFGMIVPLQTVLRRQWDKGRKNNSQFSSPSIRRPTTILCSWSKCKFPCSKECDQVFTEFLFLLEKSTKHSKTSDICSIPKSSFLSLLSVFIIEPLYFYIRRKEGSTSYKF